jgi:O-antigen ligase
MQLTSLFLTACLILLGLNNFYQRWSVGPISGLAILTLAISMGTITLIALWSYPRRFVNQLAKTTWILFLFLLWAIVLALNFRTFGLELQNVLVWATFVFLVILSARASYTYPNFLLIMRRAMLLAVIVSGTLYLAGKLIGVNIYGLRTYPIFAMLGVAWGLAEWKYGFTTGFWIASILTLFILIDLARTTLVVSIALFALVRFMPKGIKQWLGLGISLLFLGGLFWLLINHYEPLRDRFFGHDASLQIGDVRFNAMGRTKMWGAVIQSLTESPWIGKGPGSAVLAIQETMPNIGNPHNDYLRFLHDYGVIGFSLVMLGLANLYLPIWRQWKKADRYRSPHASTYLTALLMAAAVAVTMVTDNISIYVFAVFPLAIFTGASLGSIFSPQEETVRDNSINTPQPKDRQDHHNAGIAASQY